MSVATSSELALGCVRASDVDGTTAVINELPDKKGLSGCGWWLVSLSGLDHSVRSVIADELSYWETADASDGDAFRTRYETELMHC